MLASEYILVLSDSGYLLFQTFSSSYDFLLHCKKQCFDTVIGTNGKSAALFHY